jgi:hypothetical protein
MPESRGGKCANDWHEFDGDDCQRLADLHGWAEAIG